MDDNMLRYRKIELLILKWHLISDYTLFYARKSDQSDSTRRVYNYYLSFLWEHISEAGL